METALRRIADMLQAFTDAVVAWVATGAWRPETWPAITWGLVVALVLLSWLLAWRRRAPRALYVRPPQLLVTSGEVVPEVDDTGVRPSGPRRRRPRRVDLEMHAESGAFAMTVSNLSRYPVQLLEVALRDDRRGAPRVAAVDAVVPAMGSVVVSGRVPLGLRGDGWLDLYCYAAAPRVKMHRHRVELVWEPWAGRFKAAPLEQLIAPARRLASDEPDARFLEDDGLEPTVPGASGPGGAPAEARDAAPSPAPSAAPSLAPDLVPDLVRPAPLADHPAASVAPVPAPAPTAAPTPRAPAPRPAPVSVPIPAARRVAERVPTPAAESNGVPRIAAPPVGVGVADRGGATVRTSEGLPIGRSTAPPVGAATRTPAPTAATRAEVLPPVPASSLEAPPVRVVARPRLEPLAPIEPSEDAPLAELPARRRPRLEFPDEF